MQSTGATPNPTSPSVNKRPSFHEKIMVFSEFRDLVHAEMQKTDNRGLLTRPFQDYVRERFTDGELSQEYEETGITRIWLKPDSNPMRQARQYSLYLKPFIGSGNKDDDTRVWDVFSSYRFAGEQITIPFIRNTVSSARTGAGKDVWHTEPSTEFERVLYLMFIINNSQYQIVHAENRRKRRKEKKVPKFTKSPIDSCKLAFALQRVTRTWDRLARKFGFEGGIEEMILPYIIPTPTFDRFNVLETRKDGFSSKDIARTFSRRIRATSEPRLIHPEALTRGDGVDSDFRLIARYFLHDLHLVAETSSMYERSASSWPHGDLFPAGGPTARFNDFVGLLQRMLFNMGREDVTDFSFQEDHVTMHGPGSPKDDAAAAGDNDISCEVDCECQEARRKVNTFMKAFMRPFKTTFRNIIVSDQSLRQKGTVDINGNVQLIMTAPPPISETEDSLEYSDGPCLPEDEVELVVETIAELLRPGGHVIMFCSMEQYDIWHDMLRSFTYDAESSDETESESATVFSVDEQPFQFTHHPEQTDEDNECLKTLTFRMASFVAVHAIKTGLPLSEASKMVRLRRFGHVHCRHPATSNVIDNVPRLKFGEVVWCDGAEGKKWIRVEQMCMAVLRELICRFSLPGDIIVDLFAGTFSTGIASCTIREGGKMRIFVGTEIDNEVYELCLPIIENAVASVIADHTQRESLSQFGLTTDIIEAATLVHSHSKRKPGRNAWVPPPGLPVLSILPHYMTEYVLIRFQYPRSLHQVHRQPFEKWPRDIQERMQEVDVDSLRAVECLRCGVYIAPSKIRHRDAGLGVFADRTFSKGDLIAAYYGRIVYSDLSRQEEIREYGEGFTVCSKNDFLCYSMTVKVSKECSFGDKRLSEMLGVDSDSDFVELYIVPYRFTVASFINDPRYTGDDAERHGRRTRSCNVEFIQRLPYNKIKDVNQVMETNIIQVVATRNIEKNEELYGDYGTAHTINLAVM